MAPHFIRKKYGNIDLKKLSPFQRIILTTNGTLTNVIEAIFLERMRLVKLSETTRTVQEDMDHPLRLKAGETVIERIILLQGEESEQNYLHAKSYIVVDRLDEETRRDLLEHHIPIGQIWHDRQIELNKKFIEYQIEAAGDFARYFQIKQNEVLFRRTYLAYTNRKPVFMITERFPDLHPTKYQAKEAIQVMRSIDHPKDEIKEMV